MTTLGAVIRKLRHAKGFSQEELAAQLGVSRQAVSKWEKGLSSPDTENLLALAALFEVSVDELAGLRRREELERMKTPVTEESVSEVENLSEPDSSTKPQKKLTRPVFWSVAAGVLLLVFVPLWGLLQKTDTGTLPGDEELPVQSSPEQNTPEPVKPVESTGQSGGSSTDSDAPTQKDPDPSGNADQPGAVPPPWSPVEEMGEFALRWMTAGVWEHLAVGNQESLFPFGTSLRPTGMEKVYDTDFRSLTLHIVACGDLSLRYLHLLEDGMGAPATEWIDSVTTIVPGYETPRGISVGSGENEVLRRYGDTLRYVVKDSGSEVLCRHEYKYVYAPENAFGTAVIFYIADGRVAGLEIRANDDSGNEAWRVNHISIFPVKNGAPDLGRLQEPEREEIDVNRAVYIALHALKNDANLSTAEEYEYRQTIFQNLQYLDWWGYGRLGEAGKEDLTRSELSHWLGRQMSLTADEISGLLAGACRSNLDGWLTENYANDLGAVCAAYPVECIKELAAEKFSDKERETLLVMIANACAWDEQIRGKVLPALEGDPLRYTDAERVWAEELARRIRENAN